MNIEGLGKEFIRQLVEKEWVKTPADLYSLTPMDLITHFSGMKTKSAEKLIDAIEGSKAAGLERLLFGMGIRNLGNNAAKLISDKFGTLDNIINASKEDFLSIKGIGETVYDAFQEFFDIEQNKQMIEKLKLYGML